MLNTEMNYVDDLKMVLTGYRDKLEMSNLKLTVALKTDLIFGNLEEIWEFHADTLLPQVMTMMMMMMMSMSMMMMMMVVMIMMTMTMMMMMAMMVVVMLMMMVVVVMMMVVAACCCCC